MTHRARPRVHLLTGGPAWEERRAQGTPGRGARSAGFTKKQRQARKPLLNAMNQLGEAVKREDWRAARIARAAAWDEVDKLNPDLTHEERKKLWEYKQRILAGETRKRRPPRQRNSQSTSTSAANPRTGSAREPSPVWVRPPDADRLQEQIRQNAARTRAAVEKKRQAKAAKKAAARAVAKARAASEATKKPREVRVSSSVRTVSGGLPTLGKRR